MVNYEVDLKLSQNVWTKKKKQIHGRHVTSKTDHNHDANVTSE